MQGFCHSFHSNIYLLEQNESITQTVTHFGSQCKPGLYQETNNNCSMFAWLYQSIANTLKFHGHPIAYITWRTCKFDRQTDGQTDTKEVIPNLLM